jgi:amino acid adenylation domain-containing protein
MLAHYEKVLESVATDPDQSLSDIPLLAKDERECILVDWNKTAADYPRTKCVHELFCEQAAATPKAIAVVFGNESLSYQELNWRANQLAHRLKFSGAKTGSLVAISMERSLEMVIAMLATLKAGAAYVPLDPSFPADRLRFMLEDSKASLLLTRSEEKARWGELPENVRAICLDDWRLISEERDEPLSVPMNPKDLAYVIYTSGSTGWPKGVEIPHRAVVNFLQSMRRAPGLTNADKLLAVTSISFDIAGLEIFLPLTVGARLVLASAEEIFDAAKMKVLIHGSGATVMQATPSFWQFLVESDWLGDGRMKVLCGGEALSRELAGKLLERAGEVWNLYGPTETTSWSTICKVTAGTGPVSIGRPIANTQVYLLDANLQPVPAGVPGELHIGGDGVARGYLNRPELTAEKFIPNPFREGQRLYKTGDLARYRSDGNIECLGRNDFQVKLRGHRIDLGEIEAVLRRYPNVSEAVVSLREEERGQKRLIAYLQRSSHPSHDAGMLQQFLKTKLPDYMIPSAFVVLDRFPLTPNGKINRKGLPAPAPERPESKLGFTPPRTLTEESLAKIWRELLRQEVIGIDDNFFENGGHSLLAMQLLTRIRNEFKTELSLRNIFEAPTIAEFAAILDRAKNRSAAQPLQPLSRAQGISAGHAQDLLDRLDELSDAEVESLLQQISVDSGGRL